jgi:voltage-gated potassium channel
LPIRLAGSKRVSERSAEERLHDQRERGELEERLSGWADMPLAVLALIMLGLLLLELAVPLSPSWATRVAQAQTAIWVIFAAAFVIEFVLAPSKVRYLKKNWLTALSVVLPPLRSVRLLRAARALRGLSLVRIVTTLNRGTKVLGHVAHRGQFGYVLLLTLVVTVTSAAAAYYFERAEPGANIQTLGDALWWGATTSRPSTRRSKPLPSRDELSRCFCESSPSPSVGT